jgi:hypothetical protein
MLALAATGCGSSGINVEQRVIVRVSDTGTGAPATSAELYHLVPPYLSPVLSTEQAFANIAELGIAPLHTDANGEAVVSFYGGGFCEVGGDGPQESCYHLAHTDFVNASTSGFAVRTDNASAVLSGSMAEGATFSGERLMVQIVEIGEPHRVYLGLWETVPRDAELVPD